MKATYYAISTADSSCAGYPVANWIETGGTDPYPLPVFTRAAEAHEWLRSHYTGPDADGATPKFRVVRVRRMVEADDDPAHIVLGHYLDYRGQQRPEVGDWIIEDESMRMDWFLLECEEAAL